MKRAAMLLGLLALTGCAVRPTIGPPEHTGMGTVRRVDPLTWSMLSAVTHETDGGYIKVLKLCDMGDRSTNMVWLGQRADISFRWYQPSDSPGCFVIEGVQTK